MSAANPSATKCWSIFTRRERWGISWRGWAILILAMIGFSVFVLLNIQPFLTPTHRVNTKILVVEGWIQEYAMRAAATEFTNGSYQKVFTTGGPITGSDGATNDFNTSASVGADLLEKMGVPKNVVQMVPSHEVSRDRTYSSAVALRNWFHAHNVAARAINVLTEDAHARRTRLLFQEAFGDQVSVGIISIPDPDYDPKHWWRESEGVREILDEGIAYLYARIFFHPPNN